MIPQIAIAAWIVIMIGSAISAALTPKQLLTTLVLSPRQQRYMAIGFGFAALAEAATLYAGGFWS